MASETNVNLPSDDINWPIDDNIPELFSLSHTCWQCLLFLSCYTYNLAFFHQKIYLNMINRAESFSNIFSIGIFWSWLWAHGLCLGFCIWLTLQNDKIENLKKKTVRFFFCIVPLHYLHRRFPLSFVHCYCRFTFPFFLCLGSNWGFLSSNSSMCPQSNMWIMHSGSFGPETGSKEVICCALSGLSFFTRLMYLLT